MSRRAAPIAACLTALLLLPAAAARAENTIECYDLAFCFGFGGGPQQCDTYVYTYATDQNGKADCDEYRSYRVVGGNHPGECAPCQTPAGSGEGDFRADPTDGSKSPGTREPIVEYGTLDLRQVEIDFTSDSAKPRLKSLSVEPVLSPVLLLEGRAQPKEGIPLALYTIEIYTGQSGGAGPKVLRAKVARELPSDWTAEYPGVQARQLPGARNGTQLFKRAEPDDRPQYFAVLDGEAGGGPGDRILIRTKRNLWPTNATVPGVEAEVANPVNPVNPVEPVPEG